jgi:hypothetical protein
MEYMVIGDYFNFLTKEDMMKKNETLDVVSIIYKVFPHSETP